MFAAVRRVLVVDDNYDDADSIVELLCIMGHDARAAYDGAQAIEVARSFKPEFVFLYIGLTDTNGYTVALQIRALAGDTLIKLVACTGFAMADDRARAMKSGFDMHMAKPLEPGMMRRILSGEHVFDGLQECRPPLSVLRGILAQHARPLSLRTRFVPRKFENS